MAGAGSHSRLAFQKYILIAQQGQVLLSQRS